MSQHGVSSSSKYASIKKEVSRSKIHSESSSPDSVLDVFPLSIVPCSATEPKRVKFPYARLSQAASVHPKGNFSKPNVESSCTNVSDKNTVPVDRYIRKVFSQTLGITRNEISQIPSDVYMGTNPHDSNASYRLKKVEGEGKLSKFSTLALEEVRTSIRQGVKKSFEGKESFSIRQTSEPSPATEAVVNLDDLSDNDLITIVMLEIAKRLNTKKERLLLPPFPPRQ